MRNYFAKRITEWAQKDERIVLLSGDIGNRLFDKFKESCPGRFYNCGVAEANMVGVAAGMAMQGLRPVCYTMRLSSRPVQWSKSGSIWGITTFR